MIVPSRAGLSGLICSESRPSWCIILALAFILLAAVAGGRFTLDLGALLPVFAIFAIFLGCGWRLRQLDRPRLADILTITGLFYLASALTALVCAVLTASALPYADERLAAADRALGFDWMGMFALFRSHPLAAQLLIGAYDALNWTPQLLILLLGIFRGRAIAYRFLTAWAIGLLITAMVYPLFPAIAAFHHYGLRPEMMPGHTAIASWNLPGIMEGLRSGTNRSLGLAELTGVVTMPSFHAAGAIMLLWGYASFRWLRWPAALLCGTMFLSAVPVGGHYLVDIIAGLGIAVIAILLADRLHRSPAQARAAASRPVYRQGLPAQA